MVYWTMSLQMTIFSMPSRLEHVMAILSHATLQVNVFLRRMPTRYLASVTLNTSIFSSFTSTSLFLTAKRSSYIWNSAENATTYVQLTFGVFFSELARNFKLFQAGKEAYLMRFYVGHDGSMIRLAAGLGIGKIQRLRWPALGSEIVMEVSTQ